MPDHENRGYIVQSYRKCERDKIFLPGNQSEPEPVPDRVVLSRIPNCSDIIENIQNTVAIFQ